MTTGCQRDARRLLAELLNRRVYASRLDVHWCKPAVALVTQALYRRDVMGLRGFGLPLDEYEPEALLALALALQHEDADGLLASTEPPTSPVPSDAALQAALATSFQRLFAVQLPFEDEAAAVASLRDAVAMLGELVNSGGRR